MREGRSVDGDDFFGEGTGGEEEGHYEGVGEAC